MIVIEGRTKEVRPGRESKKDPRGVMSDGGEVSARAQRNLTPRVELHMARFAAKHLHACMQGSAQRMTVHVMIRDAE